MECIVFLVNEGILLNAHNELLSSLFTMITRPPLITANSCRMNNSHVKCHVCPSVCLSVCLCKSVTSLASNVPDTGSLGLTYILFIINSCRNYVDTETKQFYDW